MKLWLIKGYSNNYQDGHIHSERQYQWHHNVKDITWPQIQIATDSVHKFKTSKNLFDSSMYALWGTRQVFMCYCRHLAVSFTALQDAIIIKLNCLEMATYYNSILVVNPILLKLNNLQLLLLSATPVVN